MNALMLDLPLVLCLTSVGFYLFCIFSAVCHFSKRKESGKETEFLPPISILKSVCGADAKVYDDLASFCRQDYPLVQLLLGFQDARDPVIPVIRRLMLDFPEMDIRMVLCGRKMGINPKISNLIQVEGQAKHPFLLICDSDIRVGRDYLRRVIWPLRRREVGAVTCMCHALSKGMIGTLEALWESTEFCPHVLAASRLEGIRFGLGSTIVVKREALERIGGLSSIADYLADDYFLGNRIVQAGYRVVLSDVVVEHGLSIRSFGELVLRQIRWNRGIRVCRPWGYRGLLLTYGIPAGLLFLVLSGGTLVGWTVFGVTASARLAMAYVVGARFLNDRSARRFLWAVPLLDLMSFALWAFSLVGNTVYWRGRTFKLTREGKLSPILPEGAVSIEVKEPYETASAVTR